MNTLFMSAVRPVTEILIAAAPLLLAAMGALFTEYAGVLAVFLEGIINLAAFLCFSLTVFTGNTAAGIVSAAAICAALILAVSVFTAKTGANPFLTGLAVNLFSGGIIPVLSSLWFGTRGVISPELLLAGFGGQSLGQDAAGLSVPELFAGGTALSRIAVTAAVWIGAALLIPLLKYSRWGLRFRISGSDPEVLSARGISPERYRILSWLLAALCAAAAGCILTMRLRAFVPNVSSGQGWMALAAVYLGRRRPAGVMGAALVFTAAQYGVTLLQGLSAGGGEAAQAVYTGGATLLLALPYLVALLWFVFSRRR
jgi:simple sugar transport system permease protein